MVLLYLGYAQIYWFLSGSLNLLFCAGFVRSYFSLNIYQFNLKFWHNISRVVRRDAMTFQSHLACSFGFIRDFLDHYTALQMRARHVCPPGVGSQIGPHMLITGRVSVETTKPATVRMVLLYLGYAQIYWFLSGSLNLLFCAGFVRSYFSLNIYQFNLKFWHNISRVIRRYAMTFQSHLACSFGFIRDFLDHYTALQMQL